MEPAHLLALAGAFRFAPDRGSGLWCSTTIITGIRLPDGLRPTAGLLRMADDIRPM